MADTTPDVEQLLAELRETQAALQEAQAGRAQAQGELEAARHSLAEAGARETALAEVLEQRNAELQESNHQVTKAHDQQTALAEVLRVIASSPTDVQRVLDAIVETAARLCDAPGGAIIRLRPRDGYLAMCAVTGAFIDLTLQAYGPDYFDRMPGFPV